MPRDGVKRRTRPIDRDEDVLPRAPSIEAVTWLPLPISESMCEIRARRSSGTPSSILIIADTALVSPRKSPTFVTYAKRFLRLYDSRFWNVIENTRMIEINELLGFQVVERF